MDSLWDLSWRIYPAGACLTAGIALALRGNVLVTRGLRLPTGTPRKNFTWVAGLRSLLFGASLAVAAAGWLWHIPALVAAGLVIGFEETLETSIAAYALKESGE
ncbi:MAG: hypothetical protein AB7T37_09100 [Dehalococcoidia bacterium]